MEDFFTVHPNWEKPLSLAALFLSGFISWRFYLSKKCSDVVQKSVRGGAGGGGGAENKGEWFSTNVLADYPDTPTPRHLVDDNDYASALGLKRRKRK